MHFYTKNANYNKFETIKHFLALGEKSGHHAIVKRFEMNGNSEFKSKSGRNLLESTRKMTNKVIKKFSNTNDSVREVARKLQLKKSTVQDIKTRNGIHTNEFQIAPKYTANQLKRAKTNSGKVYRKSINKVLIIDDESYVMCDPKKRSGPK